MKTALFCFLILAIVSPVIAADDDTGDLINAAFRGDINRIRTLLAAGTDINSKNTDGLTALWIAAENGHTGIVKDLLTSGADVNARTSKGQTPLGIAKQKGLTQIIELLKEYGAKE